MDITVSNTDGVIADLSGVSAKSLRACVFAMNRAIVSGQTDMARSLASDTGLKISDIKKQLPISQANYSSPRARFGAPLERIPLQYFKARQTKRGVTYALKGSRNRIPDAFLATMKSGHPGVFKRTTKKRLPIVELYGPSLGHVFAKYRPMGLARTKDAFDTAFAHEWERAMGKPGGASG